MDQTPDMVGPYRVLRMLGAGGMGRVYLAEDTRLFRQVALKRVDRQDDHDSQERLLEEARAAARLIHPGIACIHDVLESESVPYIVMEYVPGETLGQRLYRGPLDVPEVLDIALQISAALAAAHDLGVIHRDLKPANIAVTDTGQVKILDFGLAKRQADPAASSSNVSVSDQAAPGCVMGSPPYIPPEHFLGQPIGRRGDIYSVGVTLFELLTGKRPFVGRDAGEIMEAVLTGPTPNVRDFRPSVPVTFAKLVQRAMARKPADRLSSAELHDAVKQLSADLSASTVDVPSPWSTWSSRRKLPLGGKTAAAVATLAAAVGLGAYANVGSRGLDDAHPIVAVMPLAVAASDPQAAPLGVGIADVLSSSLSKVDGVTVISRVSGSLDPAKMDPSEVARTLGATAVVSGSLQKVGDRIRLVVQITRPPAKRIAWSESFDGSAEDIFAMQARAALAIADALQLRTTSRSRAGLKRPAATDAQAFSDYSLGISLFERPDIPGNADQAIEALMRAVARDPQFARAYAGLGTALWNRYLIVHDRQWAEKAREMALEALRLDPEDVGVQCTLARIYLGTGMLPEAAKVLEGAIATHPTADQPHLFFSQYLQQVGKRSEAPAEIQKAIAIRPNYWSHYQDLGLAYYAAGRYDEAAAAFSRVTELQPDNSWGFQMLGTVQHAKGDRQRALANYNRAIQLAPNSRAYTNIGNLHYEEGRYVEAAAAFERAAGLDPRSHVKQRNLGDLYRKLGREGDAVESYGRARELLMGMIAVNPKDAMAMASLAVCEAKLGDNGRAVDHARAAVSLRPDDPDVLYRRAVVYALSGRRAEGLRALAAAIAAGYSTRFIESDDDVRVLRSAPEYRKVVADVRGFDSKRVPAQ